MDILLVAQFIGNIECFSADNNRFTYLAKLLAKEHEVEIVTTDFVHMLKKHVMGVTEYEGCKLTCLHEKGYPRNVCLQRFASHKELSVNVRKYLCGRKKPDVIYCAVPSLDVAYEAAKYAKENKVSFIIDIQDLWPEAFEMVLNIPVITKLMFTPLKKKADFIYRSADHIVAVSKTYAERGQQVNPDVPTTVVYLGSDMSQFDEYASQTAGDFQFDGSKIHIAYAGTLGHSYDLPVVFEALRRLPAEYLEKLDFIIMGDGPKKQEFEKLAEGLPVIFTGRIPYADMVWRLCRCDIAVNPITKGAAQSIINKHGDYAMAGLPVISTQECEEYRNLLKKYECGINCNPDAAEQVAEAIKQLINEESLRNEMKRNSRRLGMAKFDRTETYKSILEIIYNLKVDNIL